MKEALLPELRMCVTPLKLKKLVFNWRRIKMKPSHKFTWDGLLLSYSKRFGKQRISVSFEKV